VQPTEVTPQMNSYIKLLVQQIPG